MQIHREQIRRQPARRSSIPSVYANETLENKLNRVRAIIEGRASSYRPRARLNLLQELIRLSLLRADNASNYATAIRTHLVKHGATRNAPTVKFATTKTPTTEPRPTASVPQQPYSDNGQDPLKKTANPISPES